MKISWVRLENEDSFKIMKNLGMDVFDVKEPEQADEKIRELIKQDYHTIVVSSEIAGFSEDIIKKYGKRENIRIIITPGRN